MKKLSVILSVLFLLSFGLTLKAAQDTTDININATVIEYVNFTGTVVDADFYFDEDDLAPLTVGSRGPNVVLGTLGLESNNVGLCDLAISTTNGYRLRHTVSNQRLAGYRLFYEGHWFFRTTPELTLPCNTTPSDIEIRVFSNYLTNLQAGVYQDIVTLTVTTQ